MNLLKKLIYCFIILFASAQFISFQNKVEAMSIGDRSYLYRGEKGFYSIQKWNGTEWIYVTYSPTYFDENGQRKIAYCIDPNLKGIGWISGEVNGYEVEMQYVLNDAKLWRVYTNGYPYVSPEQMNVETTDDAYLATKMAAYAMLREKNSDDIRREYRPGQDRVEGQSLEDIKRRGEKVINAICKLVDIGNNGGDVPLFDNLINVEEVSTNYKDDVNQSYYSKIFKINSKVECKEFEVSFVNNIPEGSFIANLEGNQNNYFNGVSQFKVMIPRNKLNENLHIEIEVSAICKNYPIFYGKCTTGNYQNYMLCVDEYSKNIKGNYSFDINVNKSSIKLKKMDEETKEPLKDIKFKFAYEDGNFIGDFFTDKNGEIKIDNLKPGKIIVTEVETNKDYILDSKKHFIEIGFDESKKINIFNKLKKGSIKVIKVDSDNSEIKISNVEFELVSEDNDIKLNGITDENGEIIFKDLPVNKKYIIKEVKTAEEYILNESEVIVELDDEITKNIIFENKKKEEKIEIDILPRTGDVDFFHFIFTSIFSLGVTVVSLIVKY